MFTEDIRQFVQVMGTVMEQATPHIYLSALPFIPKKSMLQDIYVSHLKPPQEAIRIG